MREVRRAVAEKRSKFGSSLRKERPTGEASTEAYIRAGVIAAGPLDKALRAPAFLTALGIALDDPTTLSNNPPSEKLCATVESAEERKERIENLGCRLCISAATTVNASRSASPSPRSSAPGSRRWLECPKNYPI